MKKSKMLTVIPTTLALTIVAVLLVLNFATGERKIERKIERLYTTADADFMRAMGVLPGLAIVGGNRFEVLLNGERMFPANE